MANADLSSIEETMTEVKRNWNIMLQDQFNPIMVALEMLQNSNPAHDYESFLRLHDRLDAAMAIIVERYYTSFNNAVSIFGGIVDNTSMARDMVKEVRDHISEFHDQIQFKRTELPDIWSKVEKFKSASAITIKHENIKKQQTQALELARRKFFIPAARLLMSAIYDAKYLKSSSQSAAYDELIKTLERHRDSLFDLVVDEVHSIIYLRESRPSQQLFSRLAEKIPEVRSLSVGNLKRSTETTVALTDADLTLAPAEFNFDPSSHAVAYLVSLVKAAVIIEMTPQFLAVVTQRIVTEMYRITSALLSAMSKDFKRDHGLDEEMPIFVPVLKGSMDKTDLNEFNAFVPHLRRLCDRVFGHYLVVANNVHIIGEAVGSVVRESGATIDIHSFYRNCLSALHGEVKNFLSCFLHGSKTSSRVYANSTVAIVEALKGESQSAKREASTPLYQFTHASESAPLPDLINLSLVISKEDEVAAHKLATTLAVDPFSAANQEMGHRAFVKPNLQYLAILYRPFAQFDAWLEDIFAEDHKDAQYVDAVFVEGVLSYEFIPAVENYAVQELTIAFNAADALLWHPLAELDQTLPIGRGAGSLLICVSSFVGLMCHVASLIHLIPGSQAEGEQLMLSLMNQFLEKCDAKFRELVTSKTTEEGLPTFVAISSTFVANASLRQLLQQHSFLAGAEDREADRLLSQKEALLLEKLKSDRSLHRNEIIFDYRILRSLTLLHRSLEQIPSILQDNAVGRIPSFPKYRPEFRADENGRLMCNFFDGTTRRVIAFTSTFETAYSNFLGAVSRLALTCLFVLRIELRMHCFYFLDLAYREGNYDLEETCNEPDPYVSSLASDLIRFESLVGEWLPYSRYHTVMDGLDQGLVTMLLSDFRYIRSLNAFGCNKLECNVSTLEQILSLITTDQVSALEAARQFYRLASSGPDKFIEAAARAERKFTMQQYQSILDVYYRDHGGDAAMRKLHQNQLVRLKYLLEGRQEPDAASEAADGEGSASPRQNNK